MPTTYRPAPEVEDIARDLIPQHHKSLESHGVRIEYVFCTPTPRRNGCEVWGTASKLGGKAAFFAREDVNAGLTIPSTEGEGEDDGGAPPFFVITISEDIWKSMKPEHRVALVDHELCHCMAENDEKGNTKLRLVAHDLEEFRAVVGRHGYWREEVEAFVAALDGHSPQLRLVEMEEKPEPVITVTTGDRSVSMPISAFETAAQTIQSAAAAAN